jgi:AraC-like DNA-binding protein
MLAGDKESITEIAMRTGFAKPGALTQAFRRFYGVTPTAYRENSKIREASPKPAAVPFAT